MKEIEELMGDMNVSDQKADPTKNQEGQSEK